MASVHHQVAGQCNVLLAAPLIATLLLGTAACGSGSDGPEGGGSKQPSKTPSATKDPASADKKQVIKTVTSMNNAQNDAFAKGSYRGTDVETYATDKALARIDAELLSYQQAGVVLRGEPSYSKMRVTAVDIERSPKRATVETCVDSSQWTPVDKSSGKKIKVEGPRRYIVRDSLSTVGKDWLVVGHHIDKERSC